MAGTENICVECNICCDGHLFNRVPLVNHEEDLCGALGLEVQQGEAKSRFMLPCPRLGDQGCTVYELRPKACRIFRCHLLKEYEAGRVSTQQALSVIARMHAFAWYKTLRPKLLELVPGQTGTVSMHVLAVMAAVEASPDPVAVRRQYGAALVQVSALLQFLKTHFYGPQQNDAAVAESERA